MKNINNCAYTPNLAVYVQLNIHNRCGALKETVENTEIKEKI